MVELNKEQMDAILEEVAVYSVQLEEDPTLPHLGTRYLQKALAQCRNFTNRVQHYLHLAMRTERTLNKEIKEAELDFDFKIKHKLADDPIVRQQKALDDRKAVAESLLQVESENLRGLRVKILDVQETVKMLKLKYADLQRTSGDIKVQRALVRDDKMEQLAGREGFSKPQTNQDKTVPGGLPAPVPMEPLGPRDILDPNKRPENLLEPKDELHATQIAEFLTRHPERKRPEPTPPRPNGMLCSICRAPQSHTLAGVTCVNGHGGAESVAPGPEPKTDLGAVTYEDLLT